MENIPNNISRIIIPRKTLDEEKKKEILANLNWVSDKDIQRIWEAMKKAEEKRLQREKEEKENSEKKSELIKTILEYLKKNHIKVEENQERFWYKWRVVHLHFPASKSYSSLPPVERYFAWFDFDYFESYDRVDMENFESNWELEKKSYSIKDIAELLNTIRKYMMVCWVYIDEGVDFENDLNNWKTDNYGCDTWDCLAKLMWMSSKKYSGSRVYRMKDKNVAWNKTILWQEGSRAEWFCGGAYCRFNTNFDGHDMCRLFLESRWR